jgi:hypothetical protein
MHRLAPVLLIGGALLLATSLGAPAAPTPTSPLAPLELMDAQATAVLAEVNSQVDRLRDRLQTRAEPPVPDRDPFNFGGRPLDADRLDVPLVIDVPPPMPLPRPLPRVVAVITESQDGAIVRRAFVAFGENVLEVRAGDRVGPFVVQSIGDGVIDLVDDERSTSHRITAR